jgi:hypothetical protein
MTGNNKGIVLQERDRRLLRALADLRVVDREQAKCVAGFRSTTRANARLLALVRAGLLRRFFLGTVGRARKALYAMSKTGANLIGVPCRGPRRGQDTILAADVFVNHQLKINELYCRLKHEAIPIAGVTFLRWRSFYEPLAQGVSLIPDGYAEVAIPNRTLAMFLEVDLGNESRSVWQRKVQAYLQYAVSDNFAATFGQTQFRTLVVAHSERRLASLKSATAALTDKIFWFATFDDIYREGFWSAIWRRPTGDGRQPLI